MIDVNQFLEVENCVYKLHYGDRYIIAKGKTLAGSLYLIEKGYAAFIAGGKLASKGHGHKEWEGKNTYYRRLYTYIQKNPGLLFRVEVLLEDSNGYNLLKKEQTELDAGIRDKRCLNSNVTSYIPQYRPTSKSYGWISRAHVLCFKKYLKQPHPIDANSR